MHKKKFSHLKCLAMESSYSIIKRICITLNSNVVFIIVLCVDVYKYHLMECEVCNVKWYNKCKEIS